MFSSLFGYKYQKIVISRSMKLFDVLFANNLGSTAVHGKTLLVTNIAKNLWILKAASCQTAERTDHARTLF